MEVKTIQDVLKILKKKFKDSDTVLKKFEDILTAIEGEKI